MRVLAQECTERREVLRASGKAVWTWPPVVAADAGLMNSVYVHMDFKLITAAMAFGSAAKKFWRLRTWTLWMAFCVLTVGHFALLSRLHWQQAGYFWLPVVVGIPEGLALVIFVLGLAFDPHGNLTKPES